MNPHKLSPKDLVIKSIHRKTSMALKAVHSGKLNLPSDWKRMSPIRQLNWIAKRKAEIERIVRQLDGKGGKIPVRIVEHEPFVGSHKFSRIFQNEIRLDNDLKTKWRPYVLFHERYEQKLMGKGMSYSEAHFLATNAEKNLFRKKFGRNWEKRWKQYSAHVYYVAKKEAEFS